MLDFYFIRHAEAAPGLSRMDRDFNLTERGQDQAHALGRQLKGTGVSPSKIYCSRLTRARQTAAILSEYVTAPIEERLDLIEHGSEVFLLECSIEDAIRRHPGKLEPDGQIKTVQGDGPGLNWAFSIGGEDMRALHTRARKAWKALKRTDTPAENHCLIVSHGSFLSALLTEAFELPLRPFWNFQFSNCGCLCVRHFEDGSQKSYPTLRVPGPFGE